ncbi:MAG: DUF4157 domain-containing protein [Nannocystaceae bacterium]
MRTEQPTQAAAERVDTRPAAERDALLLDPTSAPVQMAAASLTRSGVRSDAIVQLQRRGRSLSAPPPGVRRTAGLPPALQSGVESLSRVAMDDVRVHYNSPEPRSVGALAFTKGASIHLGPRQERHLPHEAWHVVQQKQGRVAATRQDKGVAINDSTALEREATTMGARALARGRASASTSAAPREAPARGDVIQRIEAAQDTDGNWISQISPGSPIALDEGYIRVTNFASIADTTFGSLGSKDHAYVGLEYVDSDGPTTVFTDLTHDGVRVFDGVHILTGGITLDDTGGVQTRAVIADKIASRRYSGTTYRVSAAQAKRALVKARAVAGDFLGKSPPRGSDPRYKFAKAGWGVGSDHYINCARFAHKVLKAGGIDVSAGTVALTPYTVANIEDPSKDESVLDGTDSPDVKSLTKSLKDLPTTSSWGALHGPIGRASVKLTEPQKKAMSAWTKGIGKVINSFLRGDIPEDEADILASGYGTTMSGLLANLNGALDRLADRSGKSYRCSQVKNADVYRKLIRPGDYVMERGYFASATARGISSVGTWGRAGYAWYELNGATGKYIAPYSGLPGEREVVFKPGTVFKVNAIKYGAGDALFVVMTEVRSPPTTAPIKSVFDGTIYGAAAPTAAPTATSTSTTTSTTTTTAPTTTSTVVEEPERRSSTAL